MMIMILLFDDADYFAADVDDNCDAVDDDYGSAAVYDDDHAHDNFAVNDATVDKEVVGEERRKIKGKAQEGE